ncbi:MAG TPA: AAA family ATPase [Candidatus Binataceae bacterium]|nr:AAA family ATPase [Candidatus Binataceae bacterium]
MVFRFGRFRFDADKLRLEGASGPIPLNNKALEVLRVLVAVRGEVVTTEQILDQVWPDTHVAGGVIKVRIAELRSALGDSAARPRFIQTAHRRGYRFIAEVDLPSIAGAPPGLVETSTRAPLVGRGSEIALLEEHLARALTGDRQVVFISGEPGIGKTALVEHFVASAARRQPLTVAAGQCREHFGSAEAYMPVLEAVSRLVRESAPALSLLRRYAPTWLAQLPWLIEPTDHEKLAGELLGAARDRMPREIGEFLEALAAQKPLILVLEDLHWSDPSTVDLVSLLAERREGARFLLLATYRPVELILARHPLRAVSLRLASRGQCQELALDQLGPEAVVEYLEHRFDGSQFPFEAAALLHRRSDGNALFMVALVEHLVARGTIVKRNGRWEVADTLRAELATVPESLRRLIEEQSSRLDPEDRELLEVASLAGANFSAAVPAAAAQNELQVAEKRLERLAGAESFIHYAGAVRWPDGSISGGYAFRHALYRESFAAALSPRRRVDAHLRIGETLERAYGERASELASELAIHFEEGSDARRSVRYRRLAAETAARRYAFAEAQTHLEKGLQLLSNLPPSAERNREELLIQSALGSVRIATMGYVAEVVEQAYARAFALSVNTPQCTEPFPVFYGIWTYHFARRELDRALDIGQRNLRIAQAGGDRTACLEAHQSLWGTYFFRGEYSAALNHLDQGEPLYDRADHQKYVPAYGHDPKVAALSYRSFVLWEFGHIDRSLETNRRAVDYAESLQEPMSLAFALIHAAWLRLCRREPKECREKAEAALALARAQGMSHWIAHALWFRGWALAEQGLLKQGIADLEEAFTLSGKVFSAGETFLFAILAAARQRASRLGEARALMEQVKERVAATSQRLHEPEISRFDAELVLAEAGGAGCAPIAARNRAEALLRAAIECARGQGSRTLELRSMTALARLCRGSKAREIRAELAQLFGSFTEGFDTADLKEAKVLLDELSA